jgi:hypothetical protein
MKEYLDEYVSFSKILRPSHETKDRTRNNQDLISTMASTMTGNFIGKD